ncbi:MAG: hypothetical protein B6D37_01975 [Sphingobacteriales bacterium UTBCD1]|jgi:ubiquinone/menaquinone biosynthesis C-methylase UbiE|nr:MAG: hypothetical protein B6D37_01975 [Sphingobacteriales bacterium UTBCD1]
MKKETFKFSGDSAINYDTYLGPFLFEPYAHFVAQMLPATAHDVLEVCSGTGRLTRHLANRLSPGGKLTALDLNTDMLNVAKPKVKEKPVKFVIADAQQLPFPDNSFDYVFCQFGLMFFEDKQKGVDEVYRVLKPKGKYIFATWDKTENAITHKVFFNDLLLPFFGKDSNRFLVPFSLHHKDELLSYLTTAGFKNKVVKKVEMEGTSPSALDVVNGYLLKHSIGDAVREKDPDALPVMASRFENSLIEIFGPREITMKFSAFIGEGEK